MPSPMITPSRACPKRNRARRRWPESSNPMHLFLKSNGVCPNPQRTNLMRQFYFTIECISITGKPEAVLELKREIFAAIWTKIGTWKQYDTDHPRRALAAKPAVPSVSEQPNGSTVPTGPRAPVTVRTSDARSEHPSLQTQLTLRTRSRSLVHLGNTDTGSPTGRRSEARLSSDPRPLVRREVMNPATSQDSTAIQLRALMRQLTRAEGITADRPYPQNTPEQLPWIICPDVPTNCIVASDNGLCFRDGQSVIEFYESKLNDYCKPENVASSKRMFAGILPLLSQLGSVVSRTGDATELSSAISTPINETFPQAELRGEGIISTEPPSADASTSNSPDSTAEYAPEVLPDALNETDEIPLNQSQPLSGHNEAQQHRSNPTTPVPLPRTPVSLGSQTREMLQDSLRRISNPLTEGRRLYSLDTMLDLRPLVPDEVPSQLSAARFLHNPLPDMLFSTIDSPEPEGSPPILNVVTHDIATAVIPFSRMMSPAPLLREEDDGQEVPVGGYELRRVEKYMEGGHHDPKQPYWVISTTPVTPGVSRWQMVVEFNWDSQIPNPLEMEYLEDCSREIAGRMRFHVSTAIVIGLRVVDEIVAHEIERALSCGFISEQLAEDIWSTYQGDGEERMEYLMGDSP